MILALIALQFLTPIAHADGGTEAIILSGGSDKMSNHVRYENNTRIFHNVLEESGLPRSSIKVLFNTGKDSEVVDKDSKNEQTEGAYGVESVFRNTFRKNSIPYIIDSAASLKDVEAQFARTQAEVEGGRVKRVLFFTTDHGTPNTNNYGQSYITLAGDDTLPFDRQNSFVRGLNDKGAKAVLIGTQCFSGHNMAIALKNPNACAFSSANPTETSFALDEETAEISKLVPRGAFSSYPYFFSCALHRDNGAETLAEQTCDPADADVNHDGKVSFAEAHYYAVSRMDPYSVPQISSQVYAQSVAGDKAKADPLFAAPTECFAPESSLGLFAQEMGKLVAPALGSALKDRLKMKFAVLEKLFDQPSLLKAIKAKKEESSAVKLAKLNAEAARAEAEYQKHIATLKSILTKRNEARLKREAIRSEVLAELLKKGDSIALREQARLKDSEEALADSALTPAKRQLAQTVYNRSLQELRIVVDHDLKKSSRSKAYEKVVADINRLDDERKDQEDKEGKLNSASAEVRRLKQLSDGYRAELMVISSGTPEQKSKLLQLYECENETL